MWCVFFFSVSLNWVHGFNWPTAKRWQRRQLRWQTDRKKATNIQINRWLTEIERQRRRRKTIYWTVFSQLDTEQKSNNNKNRKKIIFAISEIDTQHAVSSWLFFIVVLVKIYWFSFICVENLIESHSEIQTIQFCVNFPKFVYLF